MRTKIRLIVCIILTAMLTPQFGSAIAEDLKLAAAKRTVDDNGQDCPGAGYSSISAALADAKAGDTITICAGTYTEQLVIDSKPRLRLVGKGLPRIVLPGNAHGAVILVRNSSSVTIQGLLVDGASNFALASTMMAGIALDNSSGTVSGNIIRHIGHNPPDTVSQGVGIQVFGSTVTRPVMVKILNNTITDFQYAGVSITGMVNPAVSRNMIQTLSSGNQPNGILLNSLSGGSVSANVIANNFGFQNLTFNTGIHLLDSSRVKVASNTITGSRQGVYVEGVAGAANTNTVSGNQILDCGDGVFLSAALGSTASGNSVTKNKILSRGYWNTSFPGGVIVDGGAAAVGNKVTSNTIQGYTAPGLTDRGMGTVIKSNKWSLFVAPGA